MIWHPQMPKGSKTEFDKKELAPLAIAAGNNALTIQSRCRALEDAGNCITKLPKAEHEAAEWQPAMEALIPVATSGGPTMFARIGVMRALNCHVEVRSMVAFVFRLVYRLFCKKYFTVLPKYRRLHDRGRDERSLTPRA